MAREIQRLASVATPFSDDWFLDGRLLLRQPRKGHRIGTDALLLAAITPAAGRICDLGSGVGAIGLALALQGADEAVMVERDPIFAACARHNLAQAGVSGRARLVEADLFDRKAFLREPALADQSFDAVATNPPFDQALRGRKTPSALKHAAHAMQGGGLEDWLKAAVRLLKDGGALTLIHRADRLSDVLDALPRRGGGISQYSPRQIRRQRGFSSEASRDQRPRSCSYRHSSCIQAMAHSRRKRSCCTREEPD
jgi:tRNA1(Val) A37 N6-methylase TrmN6